MSTKRRRMIVALAALAAGYRRAFAQPAPRKPASAPDFTTEVLKPRFEFLSRNGNSSCSAAFRNSIASLPDAARLQGSCCSPMSLHRYAEQVKALRAFKSAAGQKVAEIPDDPYDIEAGLAKKLLAYYGMALTPEEQQRYDYAMQNSQEKGPCCCQCWRWHVYGGLGKHLIRSRGFSGEQVTAVWNFSDGCGGEADHVEHA